MFSNKTVISILIILLAALSILIAVDTVRWRPMTFDNPGSRRLFKSEAGNYYFYRSLPERGMLINVQDISAIEIRAISRSRVFRPEFILRYEGKRVSYSLKQIGVSGEFRVYEPVRITLPPNLKQLELICYNDNVYFRSFHPVTVKPKRAVRVPPLKILGRAGEYILESENGQSTYYAYQDSLYFSFQINKETAFSLFVRAELTTRETPVFGLYENGKLIERYELPIKRTNTYKAEGINYLTVGKRIDVSKQDKIKKYELRPLSDHLFIARPVIRKTQ